MKIRTFERAQELSTRTGRSFFNREPITVNRERLQAQITKQRGAKTLMSPEANIFFLITMDSREASYAAKWRPIQERERSISSLIVLSIVDLISMAANPRFAAISTVSSFTTI